MKNNPLNNLPSEPFERHLAIVKMVAEVEDIINLKKLFLSFIRILRGKGSDIDYKIICYSALVQESARVKELIKLNGTIG